MAPYHEKTGWITVGEQSRGNLSLTVASAIYEAGSVRLARALLVLDKAILVENSFQNVGSEPISDLHFVETLDSSPMASLGLTRTSFDPKAGTIYGSAGGLSMGLKANGTVSSFGTGVVPYFYEQVKSNALAGGITATGSTAGAETLSLGDVAPGGSTADIREVWAVGGNQADVSDRLSTLVKSIGAAVGSEVPFSTISPVANLLWNSSLSFSDLSVPPNGLRLPFSPGKQRLIPEGLSLVGNISNSYPAPNFNLSKRGDWLASSTSTGSATAYASARLWSEELGRDIGRVAVWVPSTNGSGRAELDTTASIYTLSSSPELVLRYAASFIATRGTLSSQQVYVSVNADQNYNGKLNEALAVPLAGSAYPANASGTTGTPITQSAQPGGQIVKIVGFLVADGTWRTLAVPLGNWLNPTDFTFKISVVVRTNPSDGFSGLVEVKLDTVAIRSTVQASRLLFATLDSGSSTVTVGYRDSGSSRSSYSNATQLKMGFLTAQSISLQGANGGSFSGEIGGRAAIFNQSLNARANLSSSLKSVMVYTPFAALEPVLQINHISVGNLQVDPGSLYSVSFDGQYAKSGSNPTSVSVTFRSYALSVQVKDASGNPVPTAKVLISPAGGGAPYSGETDAKGAATFKLVPWQYGVSVSYRGDHVGSGAAGLISDAILSLNANIYEIGVKPLDTGGQAIRGASVTIGEGNGTVSGVTTSGGIFRFLAVANQIYRARVTIADRTYFDGHIQAEINNAVLVLNTSYQPPLTQLMVQGSVVGAIALVAVVLVLFQRRPGLLARIKS